MPAELIKAGGRTILSQMHELINCIQNKEELPGMWKESIILLIYKKGDKTNCINYRGIFVNCIQNFIQHSAVNVNCIRR